MTPAGVGYPDGSRTVQNTQETPLWEATTPTNVQIQSPVVYAANYQRLFAGGAVAGNQAIYQANWFMDQAATDQIGSTQIAMDPAVVHRGLFVTPALGPYVQAIMFPFTAGQQFTPTLRVVLTNGSAASEAGGFTPTVYRTTQNLAANASVTIPPLTYASGRHSIRTVAGGQQLKMEVDYLDFEGGGWIPLHSWTVAAGIVDYREILFPPSATRAIMTNGSATTASNGNQLLVLQQV